MLRNLKLINKRLKFVMVRHGESVWNQDSKFTGWTNIPLTDNGRSEAKDIANVLIENNIVPKIIFTSGLKRAIETSNIIHNEIKDKVKDEIFIHTSWRLNEKHYGNLEGVPRQLIRDDYGEKFTKMMRKNFYMKPPLIDNDKYNIQRDMRLKKYQEFKNCYFDTIKDGESKEDVLNRLLPYFQNDILYTLTPDRIPLIVTHKHCARVLMKYLLNLDDKTFENYEIPSKTLMTIYLNDNMNYLHHEEIKY